MLLKAHDVTEIVIDGVAYMAESGLIDAPISPQEAILFGLDAPTVEEIAARKKDSNYTSADNAGGETGKGQNSGVGTPDNGGTGGKKSSDKDSDDGTA